MDKDLDLTYFLEIEKKYNLYEDTIDGIHYWVYSRFSVWVDFFVKNHLNLGNAHSNKKMTLGEKVTIFSKLLKKSIPNSNEKKHEVDVLFIPHPRRVLNDNVYECIYTDKLAKNIKRYAVYEQPYQWQHLEPVASENVIYGDATLLKKGLYLIAYKTILKKQYKKLMEVIEKKIEKPLQEMEVAYGSLPNRKQLIDCIATQIIFYKATVKDMEKLLTRLQPKAVIEVVGYNPLCMVVNERCKKKGITTIELQHGTMNEHMGYQYGSEEAIAQFPDKIFLFSDFWKKQIAVPVKEENLVVTGYPYFERKVKEANIISQYHDGKVNILFISQGTIGEKLSGLACELAQILDENKYRIIYKLHPGEYAVWENRYLGLKKSNVIVIDGNKYPLYDFFATCQIQVGVYSTALYEGLGFHLDTYIYEIEMAGHMKELQKNGYVKFVRNVEDLCQNIKEDGMKNKIAGDFWKENALENMIREVENN